ncbi:MAG: hypothetical protein GY948_06395 [Alphaproteobacteria bacterium]|nr:hypothetical protein [Alphaproteobacteria bacterium]
MELLNLDIWGLTAAYVALAFVLLSLHIYSRWSFGIKASVTVLVLALCAVTYKSYPGLLGWPVPSSSLPPKLYLVAIEVQEPDNVYLWAKDLGTGFGDRRPRAYQLSYSKSLHEKASKAGSKMRRGINMIVEIQTTSGVPTASTGTAKTEIKPDEVVFVEAPQGLLPSKD